MEWLNPAYYLHIKLIHIVSSTLLFGTGLGTAFFMWRADLSGDVAVIARVSKSVVLADGLFTAPAALIQPVSGYLLLRMADFNFESIWLFYSVMLFILVGFCWLPVVWIQWRVSEVARLALQQNTDLPAVYRRYMRAWYALGWPAFIAVLVIFYLMVVKPT